MQLPAGDYRFTVTVDDGVRLFVGDRTLIDGWQDQPSATHSQVIYLDGSPVTVRMEYYESNRRGGSAPLLAQPGHYADFSADLRGDSRANLNRRDNAHRHRHTHAVNADSHTDPHGDRCVAGAILEQPHLQRATPRSPNRNLPSNYNWGDGSPAASINADSFSARWTGQLSLESGSYRFDVVSDDGVRLFLDSVKRIEAWSDHAATAYYYTLQHDGGNCECRPGIL